ncbi:NINE protein [Labedella populi]|uniref:NINE protein n=1 Tax=Labedella populi TaxID=2498850 RepID=A0A3S4AVH5_9MICO|nr:TM2 domain-containing protein [Labedella populi]RWZ68248.1 NINE protein [Labedella populi]
MSDNNQPPVPPQDPPVPPPSDAQPPFDAARPAQDTPVPPHDSAPYPGYGQGTPSTPPPGSSPYGQSSTESPSAPNSYGQAPQPPAPGEVPYPPYDANGYQQTPPFDPNAYPQQGGYGGYAGGPGYGQTPGGYNPNFDPQAKSRVVAGILGILLGAFGVHRFYLGYTGIGIAMVCITVISFGTLAIVSSIWGLIEGIMILTRSQNFQTDASGRPLRDG